MLVPGKRILVWIGILLPFAVLGAVLPSLVYIAVGMFALLFALAVIDALMTFLLVKGIELSLPELVRMSKDKNDELSIRISSGASGPRSVTVGIAFPSSIRTKEDSIEVVLPEEGDTSIVNWPCLPKERGCFLIDKCYYLVPSPLMFWGVRGIADCKCEVRIYPNLLKERKRLSSIFLNRESPGVHTQRVVGQGRDFEKLREYIPGDSYDEIHWKATAKRGKPVTKLFQVERTQEIYVVIDSSRLSARRCGDETNLEQYIASALILGLVAERQGDLFGLITFNSKVRRFVRAGAGKNHYNVCRDTLYTLMPTIESPDYDELFSYIRLKVRRRALVLILTDLADPMLAESFMRNIDLVCKKHIVMASMIRQPGAERLFSAPDVVSTDDVYKKLGGHMVWRTLAELTTQLQRKGVNLSLIDKDNLSAEMVAQYMNVKSRQIL